MLKVLVEHHGRLVTKEHLHEAVWAPSIVTDDSLAHCVIEIRRALGANGRDMIRTVPRRGYVFEPDVHFVNPAPDAHESEYERPVGPRVVLAALALVATVFVGFYAAERLSPARKESAAAQQTETRPGPDSTARANPAGVDPAAYRHYLKGRFFYDRRAPGDLDRAETAYRQAVESDPSLADAWIGLAATYNVRTFDGSLPEEEALYRLGEAAHRALALDPDDGEAQVRMASYFLRIGQTRLASEHFERALSLEPDNPLLLSMLAGRLFYAARLDEAVALQQLAAELAPLSPIYTNNLVSMLLSAGRTTDALEVLETLEGLTPSDTQSHAAFRADLLTLEGRYEEALQYGLALEDGDHRDSRLAIIFEALHSPAEAGAAFERLRTSGSAAAPYHIAEVYAWRGEADTALRWLSSAGDADYLRSLATPERVQVSRLLLSPLLAPLRKEPQWQAMIAATQPEIPIREPWLSAAIVR